MLVRDSAELGIDFSVPKSSPLLVKRFHGHTHNLLKINGELTWIRDGTNDATSAEVS